MRIPTLKELVKELEQAEPYILCYEDQLFLIIDCTVINKVGNENLPLLLLYLFFTFNIKYPKGSQFLLLSGSVILC